MVPNILSIAGSDPSGGAGIQADIKAISANGGYAMAAITALTAQNTRGVRSFVLAGPDMVRAQIEAIVEDIRIDAIKIGMLGDVETTLLVAELLAQIDAPVVVDPVMIAKGGDRLLSEDAVAALRDHLLPRASLLTPNLPEAAALLGETGAKTPEEMRDQGRRLLELGCGAVLVKGGHLPGEEAIDVLVTREEEIWLEARRFDTRNTHGTGCTLSSALATELGHGRNLKEAAYRAKAYIGGAIAGADRLDVGRGQGPTHHFHAFADGD
ncbi:bifunctional hydroxymethylpyrimidine kinase/phosphomethylpyrimidine kinase [Fulvimarina endophytica]|uniref:hydroxymethylpyrimidine kinase n=1 Tax=Fulvimarina endophytica TaxID=2293836 RepID=A0A371X3F5_9HYPH|nr:bifunctional hydroxymethylpyrimidine kinase/phosphomethylpyrimidine kinase [Fulvimarina endophytica]RFC63743.1 bifunctional hydroxymethylpyrimidine kinase/phosphomethylpyrimidine kinase [Fulvimarina endophytica]